MEGLIDAHVCGTRKTKNKTKQNRTEQQQKPQPDSFIVWNGYCLLNAAEIDVFVEAEWPMNEHPV